MLSYHEFTKEISVLFKRIQILLVSVVFRLKMTLKLYYFEASPPARSVLMVIELLQLKVQLIRVNLSEKEQLKQEFLQLNPIHTVPTLDDDGFVVWDSHAIVQYLVEKYGQTDDLYPKGLKERTIVNQMLFFETDLLFPSLARAVRPVFYDDVTEIPEDKLADIETSYGFLETFLQNRTYIASDVVTVADICALATVSTISIFHSINEQKYPKLKQWYEDLTNKDFYKANLEGIQKFTDMWATLLK